MLALRGISYLSDQVPEAAVRRDLTTIRDALGCTAVVVKGSDAHRQLVTAETALALGLDVWIEAQFQEPAPRGNDPALPKPESPDDVNHLQYAIQWFAFAAIALIGWPIVVWRRGKRPTRSE